MAYNVFGSPITTSALEKMPEFKGKTISLADKAHVAFNLKNAEDKDKFAQQYVEKLKEQSGSNITTLCLIYNATGGPITLVNNQDWYGHISQGPIPVRIENGQWGGFVHVKPDGKDNGTQGAVVYRGVNDAGETCDLMAAWSNPWDRVRPEWVNSVYTEIREAGHFNDHDYWGLIKDTLNDRSSTKRDHNVFNLFSTDTLKGFASTVATGCDTTALLEAIFTLENIEA